MKPRRDLGTLLLIALAGYAAPLLVFVVHELAHGVAALLMGGRFHDFFVSPLEGFANTTTEPERDWVVTAAGSPAAFVFGLIMWAMLRRHLRRAAAASLPLAIIFWSVANEAILDSVAYTTLQGAFGRIIGAETGDWVRLSARWSIPPWALLVAGLVVAVPLCIALMRDARVIVEALSDTGERVRPLFAYWFLVLPGTVLLLLYLAALSPWRTTPAVMALGSVLGAPLLSLPAAAVQRWTKRFANVRTDRMRGQWQPRRATALSFALAGAALLAAFAFGPIVEWRRGIVVGSIHPDRYGWAAQRITLDVDVRGSGPTGLRVRSEPRLETGSPFVRSMTGMLASTGPSAEGAMHLTEFIARWNLDGATVVSVSDPARQGDAWTWSAELEPLPDSVIVRIWPVTVIADSYIDSLRIAHRGSAGGAADMAVDGERLWIRPSHMSGVDSFPVVVR